MASQIPDKEERRGYSWTSRRRAAREVRTAVSDFVVDAGWPARVHDAATAIGAGWLRFWPAYPHSIRVQGEDQSSVRYAALDVARGPSLLLHAMVVNSLVRTTLPYFSARPHCCHKNRGSTDRAYRRSLGCMFLKMKVQASKDLRRALPPQRHIQSNHVSWENRSTPARDRKPLLGVSTITLYSTLCRTEAEHRTFTHSSFERLPTKMNVSIAS